MTYLDKDSLKLSYNNFAEERDQSPIQPWKFHERENFLNQLKKENKKTLLEIGAGPGRDGLYFQENGLSVVCIDLSEEMVKRCKEKGLEAYCMDFYQMDFPDHHFDAVYAMNCLLHVPKSNIDEVLKEVRRVLKPKGLFFYGVYGGQDTEGIWEGDKYTPKRFFSMYRDEDIQEVVKRWFSIKDFHTVSMGEGNPHFQSILLVKQ